MNQQEKENFKRERNENWFTLAIVIIFGTIFAGGIMLAFLIVWAACKIVF